MFRWGGELARGSVKALESGLPLLMAHTLIRKPRSDRFRLPSPSRNTIDVVAAEMLTRLLGLRHSAKSCTDNGGGEFSTWTEMR